MTLNSNIQDAITLIEYAAQGKITIKLALDHLLDQRAALIGDCENLDQQINETRCRLDRASQHLQQAITNLLVIRDSL